MKLLKTALLSSIAFFIITLASLTPLVAKIIGEDNRQLLSANPNELEAKIGEAIGAVILCNKSVGKGTLVKIAKKFFVITTAHGFPRTCFESGSFYPDLHYRNSDSVSAYSTSKFDRRRAYSIDPRPVNKIKYYVYDNTTNNVKKMRYDFLIFSVDQSISMNQFGEPRMYADLLYLNEKELLSLSGSSQVFISGRDNKFHKGVVSSIQYGCNFKEAIVPGSYSRDGKIHPSTDYVDILSHDCDTNPGYSGSAILFLEADRLRILGIHVGGHVASNQEFSQNKESKGNSFIMSRFIIYEMHSQGYCLSKHRC
jgi:hypothetical protein